MTLDKLIKSSAPYGLARGLRNLPRFRNEFLLYHGREKLNSELESVFVVNVHKAASTLAPKLISSLLPALGGRIAVDIVGYLWTYTSFPLPDSVDCLQSRLYRPRGYIYVPLRRVFWADAIASHPVVAIVRDPRDVLVSFWYSHAFSHDLPYHPKRVKEFEMLRAQALRSNPASYWRQQLPFVKQSYESIMAAHRSNARMIVLRYEDMLDHFDEWISGFAHGLGLGRPDQDQLVLLREVAGIGREATGDWGKHVRAKDAGQYLNEWDGATIREVSRALQSVLDYFGY